jgi:PadR family transcriptional regulator, regulatory protein PadR
MKLKGTLSPLILQVLAGGPNHGYRIVREIQERSEGVLNFKEGALYPALHALEGDGALESFTQVEKGRTRRYYRITESGRKALDKERQEWQRVTHAVSLILEGN